MNTYVAFSLMLGLLELSIRSKAINAKLPVIIETINVCSEGMASLSTESIETKYLDALKSLLAQTDRLLALCGRNLVRLSVASEALTAVRMPSKREFQWDDEGMKSLLEAGIASWDSMPEDGAEGLISLQYMLFGHTWVSESESLSLSTRVDDGEWVITSDTMVQEILEAVGDFLGSESSVTNLSVQQALLAKARQLEDAFWSMRERLRACRETLSPALRLFKNKSVTIPEQVAQMWTRVSQVLETRKVIADDVDRLVEELDKLIEQQGTLVRDLKPQMNTKSISLDELIEAIRCESKEYPLQLREAWMARGLKGISAN